jgi:hypothetical protein
LIDAAAGALGNLGGGGGGGGGGNQGGDQGSAPPPSQGGNDANVHQQALELACIMQLRSINSGRTLAQCGLR